MALLLGQPQMALASPYETAAWIVAQMETEELDASIKQDVRSLLVRGYARALDDLGGSVADPGRFAAMLPDAVVADYPLLFRHRLSERLAEVLTADELSGVAAFMQTETGALLFAVGMQPHPVPGAGHMVSDIGMFPGANVDLSAFLTTEEMAEYAAFLNSEAGRALRRERVGVSLSGLGAYFFTIMHAQRAEPRLSEPYVIEILETDGIVTFPNRIARRDVIRSLATLP